MRDKMKDLSGKKSANVYKESDNGLEAHGMYRDLSTDSIKDQNTDTHVND